MTTETIYNRIRVSDDLLTGGQPTEAELRAAAAEGVRTVINLATHDPQRSLPDEAGLVRSLGLSYHHIPVDWRNPTEADFDAFDRLMQSLPPGKLLIHCAANFRVTTFYALYALRRLGWSKAQADAFRARIWQGSNYPIWEAFYARLKARLTDHMDTHAPGGRSQQRE